MCEKKTRQQINKEYYIKNKEKVKALVTWNQEKKKNKEKEQLKQAQDNALSRGETHFSVHIQHLRQVKVGDRTQCECGGKFRSGDGARHSKTKKHIDYFCKILKEEQEKYKLGLPTRYNEIFMERNHTIIKSVFDKL